MRAAILAIGSELLGVDRLDTNSLRLTALLERFGVALVGKCVAGDREEAIAASVRRWLREVDLLLVTGGLGPTTDDVTRSGVALALDRGLRHDPEIEADIVAKFQRFGMVMPAVNRRQAEVVEGAEILDNRRGTAPGQRLRAGSCTLFLLPGVPAELEHMLGAHVEPWLESLGIAARRESRTLRVACLAESTVEERLAPVYREIEPGALTVLAAPADIRVRICCSGPAEERALRLTELSDRIAELVGDAVYSRRRNDSLERVVGGLLRDRRSTVATAESCTGGLVAERLTAVAGSSDYFLGAAVTYSNQAKSALLAVPPALLDRHGAVSEVVVLAMADGARQVFGADYGIAVSGIAGPGGGSADKPVGLVHIAVKGPENWSVHRRLSFPGDRRQVRRFASQWGLDLLRRRLTPGAAEAARASSASDSTSEAGGGG